MYDILLNFEQDDFSLDRINFKRDKYMNIVY